MSSSEDEMVVDGESEEEDSQNDEESEDCHDEENVGDASTSQSDTKKEPRQVYLPGHQMQEGESLVFDPSAYHMLHDVDAGN